MWLVKHVAKRSHGSDWRSYFLIGCVAVLALLLAGASWSAWQSSQERRAAQERQVHTLEVLLATDGLRTAALQQIRGGRGFLLTGNDGFLLPFEDGQREAIASHDRLSTLVLEDREQSRRTEALKTDFAHLETVLQSMIESHRGGRTNEAMLLTRSGSDRDAIEAIMRSLDEIETSERATLASRMATAEARATANERYQYVLTAIGLLLLGLSLTATIYVRRALGAEAEARRELLRFASTDELTNLPNRRSFIEALNRSIARATSDTGRKLSLAIFDIDHFKRINDRFGHPAGDEVIREVAVRALEALRKRDLVGRIGGEEFAVILPKAGLETAGTVCERLREAIAGKPVVHGDAIIPFTVSIGIAEFEVDDDIDRLMARADVALYDAKTGGRNQVRLAA